MKIRLGYVAMCRSCEMPFKTITYTEYSKKENKEKLHDIIVYNLKNTIEILKYNIKNDVHFYRMTSNLIPLATKDDVEFNYITPYLSYYQEIASIIEKNKMRIDMHPDQYVVLNSTREEVKENAKQILYYHASLLNALRIQNPLLVLHAGSSVLGKQNSLKRFINTFKTLPEEIGKMIAIENDDKTFDIKDVLYLCETLHLRMILDYHHYICNTGGLAIKDYYKRIFATWKQETPKMHFSSPKNKTKKDMRSHHDYIDADAFIAFLESVKNFDIDLDIMLEAKEKDMALFKLVRELKYKTNYTFLDDTTFEI
ncbi:MAG: UV DNA damage repair endonuclease UvsE [Bacilli bacterium]|nr:UV DNA damage repair endonuclease UvsE [Bacilli bacterium]